MVLICKYLVFQVMNMQRSVSKKVLSIFLTFLLVITLCPVSVLAKESPDSRKSAGLANSQNETPYEESETAETISENETSYGSNNNDKEESLLSSSIDKSANAENVPSVFEEEIAKSSSSLDPIISEVGSGFVTLTWEKVPNATKYAVSECLTNGTYVVLNDDIDETTYTVQDLSNNVRHYFLVQAYVNGKWSTYTDANLISATPEGPTKPTPEVTGVDNGSVSLSWDAVPGATKYAVSTKNANGTYNIRTTNVTGASYTLTGLTNALEYSILVQAYIDGKWSTYTDGDLVKATPVSAQQPAPRVDSVGLGSVTLSWDAVPGATKYAVSTKNANGTYNIRTTEVLDTSYTLVNLMGDREYSILVQAYVNGKWSTYTDANLISATPEGPTKPTPEVTGVDNGSVSLSWDAVPGATKYAVSTKNANGTYNIRTTNVTGASYTLTGLTNALEYSILVQAYIDGKWSTYTDGDLVKATPVSAQQPAPRVDSVGLGSVTLSWDAVPGATKYAVSTKNANGTYNIRTTEVLDTSYTLVNLMGDREYSILVQAYVNGKWSTYTDANLISATPEGPTKPTPEVTGVDNGSVSLSWDAVPGATKYAVSTKNANGTYNIRTTNVTGASYTLTGLTNALEYSILVQAYIDGKWSTYTDGDLVKATPVSAQQPAPRVDSVGLGSVTLSWDAVPGATKYAVSTKNANGTYNIRTTEVLDTSYTLVNLMGDREYSILVQAYVNGKWSTYTDANLISATPEGPTKPTPEVTGVDNGSVSLSWDAVPGATKYAVSTKNANGTYNIRTTNVTGASYTLTGLTNALEYSILVQAYIDGKWSTYTDGDLVKATPVSAQQPAPKITALGDGTVTLSWEPIPGATKYAVSEYLGNEKYDIISTEIKETTFTVDNLSNLKTHYFLVQACLDNQWTTYTGANHIGAIPFGPIKPTTTASAGERLIELSWEAISGATKYAVSIKKSDGTYDIRANNITATSYTLTDLKGNEEYSILVQAYIDSKWSTYTDGDLVKATPIDSHAPSPWVESTGNGSATIAWDAVPGASEYAVARYVDNKYILYTTNCKETSYYLNDLGNGYNNYILVQARVNGVWSSDSAAYRIVAHPEGPTRKPALTASAGIEQVILKWNKVPGATKYAVSYKTAGTGFTTVTRSCTNLSYTVTGLTGGKQYQFLVQAYVCGHWSSYNDYDLVSATPKENPLSAEQRAMRSYINGYSSGTQWLIAVNRSTHRVGVFKGGRNNWSLQYYWSCVTGAPSTPTITGPFLTDGFKRTALTTDSRAIWCTRIYGGYFFHSILASESELGQSLSHGCIRLPYSAARWIYDNIFSGTRVVIYN